MNAYEELCQHTEGQPEQARRILASNREFDTFQTDPNNFRSAVIVKTANAFINESKEEQTNTPAVEGVVPVNTE